MGLNKQKKKKEWCSDESVIDAGTKGLVRCPTCNKRLMPRALSGKGGSVTLKLPPHKEK